MSFEWSNAPEWATHIALGGSKAWVCSAGYNYLPNAVSMNPFTREHPRESFHVISSRPGQMFQLAKPDRIAAHEFLERGAQHMRDRAASRDAPDGERSMARCVTAFNAQEGTNLTEAQGWRFMIQLKYARSVHGSFVADDYEDLCAYAGLAGEAAQS